jgi:hypothetical protein
MPAGDPTTFRLEEIAAYPIFLQPPFKASGFVTLCAKKGEVGSGQFNPVTLFVGRGPGSPRSE